MHHVLYAVRSKCREVLGFLNLSTTHQGLEQESRARARRGKISV